MKKEFNGFNFDKKETRKRMKYLVISEGDLDINNAYAFQNKRELNSYLKAKYNKKTLAVFEIKDITESK